MGRTCRLLCLGVIAASLSLPAATQAGSRPACSSAGSKTVISTERARIFSKRAIFSPNYRVTRLYGCLYRRNGRFRLSTLGEPGIFVTAVPEIRLAGNFVAYAEEYEGPAGGNYGQIRVRRLNTGVQTFSGFAATEDFGDRTTGVTDLELRATGASAWIAKVANDAPPAFASYQVHMQGASGRTLLDEGTDVDPGSLALSGATLYWSRGGLPRSAALR